MNNAIETAWGIIANAYGGNWDEASDEWREAAIRWRDTYVNVPSYAEDGVVEVEDEKAN